MKYLVLTFVAVFALAPQAEARTQSRNQSKNQPVALPVARAELTEIQADPKLNEHGYLNGSVQIDFQKKTLKLVLQPKFSCPEGMVCAAVMPAPEEVELPITRTVHSLCGDIYEAEEDRMPVDGLFRKVTVHDHSGAMCRMFFPFLIQVTYETRGYNRMESELIETKSTFQGNAWKLSLQ